MREHQHAFELAAMSRAFAVSRSGFHAQSRAGRGGRSIENERLGIAIERIHRECRGHYGSPRVQMALEKEGQRCGRNRIARIMRRIGLQGVRQSRKRVMTTNSKHGHRASPNLIKGLEITGPDQVWASDIPYIRTAVGWVYLAVVIDLYSRKVVGWEMADSLEAAVVIRALQQALSTRDWKPGLIYHSDRGVQYACRDFRMILEENGILQSMSAKAAVKGNCYDNATVESFFGTLKAEEGDQYPDWQSARRAIFDYLETYYNRTRIHTSLAGCSPEEFEIRHHTRQVETGAETSPSTESSTAKPSALNEFSKPSGAPLVIKASPIPIPEARGQEGRLKPEESTQADSSGSHDHQSHHPGYPSEGCSPAEPSSVSSERSHKDSKIKLAQVNKKI